MSQLTEQVTKLVKALEAGQITGAPGTLTQGAALQIQEIEDVMHNVCAGEEELKLTKLLPSKKHKSMLVRFKRQLSYGDLGGSAQLEGAVGDEETGDYVEAIVPMCFYSHTRRVTVAANMVAAFDGVKAEDREAANAAMKLAMDIEFDSFQGKAHFSNGGLFDGNPLAIPGLPNLPGLDVQIRQSDVLTNTQDLMFAEYGSSESVVLDGAGGTLTQGLVEDIGLRSRLNFAKGNRTLMMDPVSLSKYNKLVLSTSGNVTQFATMGSALSSSGADLRNQSVSNGSIKLDSSQFLRGKYRPRRLRNGAPSAPSISSAPASDSTAPVNPFAGTYVYQVTAENERGESLPVVSASVTIDASHSVAIGITATGSVGTRFFNVYRSDSLGSAASAKFIGRIANPGTAVTFHDLNAKAPASVNAYLIAESEAFADAPELAPFSQAELAQTDLSVIKAFFQFKTVAVRQPRKLALIHGLSGVIR